MNFRGREIYIPAEVHRRLSWLAEAQDTTPDAVGTAILEDALASQAQKWGGIEGKYMAAVKAARDQAIAQVKEQKLNETLTPLTKAPHDCS